MSMCAILIDVVLMWCFLVVTVEGGLRFRRQLEDNAIIELFNNCKCVLYYQCSPNNTVIIHGENLINVRLKEKTPTTTVKCNGGQFDGELVCCQLPDVNNTAAEPRNPVITDETTSVTPYTHQCGVQRTKINVRIITDSSEDDVTPLDGEFPWITAIYKKNKRDKWIFYCSGALIHPKVVLTANHYFHRKSAENFKIILTGNIELTTVGNAVDNERNVAEIVNHPKYYGGALHNDGALLVLEKPFESTTTNSINSICLPPVDLNMENGRCLVAGWGEGSTEDGTKVLKKVDLPLVPINKCKQQLKKTRLGQNFELHESFMCAGGEKDKDACKGDGGSPLMCLLPGETRYFHMGIVSWGIGCGTENVPGVYASTFKMRSWILEELNKRSLAL